MDAGGVCPQLRTTDCHGGVPAPAACAGSVEHPAALPVCGVLRRTFGAALGPPLQRARAKSQGFEQPAQGSGPGAERIFQRWCGFRDTFPACKHASFLGRLEALRCVKGAAEHEANLAGSSGPRRLPTEGHSPVSHAVAPRLRGPGVQSGPAHQSTAGEPAPGSGKSETASYSASTFQVLVACAFGWRVQADLRDFLTLDFANESTDFTAMLDKVLETAWLKTPEQKLFEVNIHGEKKLDAETHQGNGPKISEFEAAADPDETAATSQPPADIDTDMVPGPRARCSQTAFRNNIHITP